MRKVLFGTIVTCVCIGCGGGGGGAASTTGSFDTSVDSNSATLDDGIHFASLNLIANSSGSVGVTASAGFDTLLVVEKTNPDGTAETIAEDDDGGGGTNSKTSFSAIAGTHYTVIVTSASGDASGALEIGYSSPTLQPTGAQASRSSRATAGTSR